MPSPKQLERALFEEALNLADPAEREAFIVQSCGQDTALRLRLEQLLKIREAADVYFDKLLPEKEPASPTDAAPNPDDRLLLDANVHIDRYKLLRRLGEGGCGVVYLAEQQEPVRREVALKIIRLGMDTESIIARFEKERQALALMDHPNIARVLDAGATASGRPYFAMELVQGLKITEYCDQNRLDITQRLALFIQVCNAIQHAHQKGIIHRDIKPSNILVALHDGAPVPKVIDFGIAKATAGWMANHTAFTPNAPFIGTPAYMSPEQAKTGGLDVDTRSDVYSLGVLLYELLTGRPPFDTEQLVQAGVDEMRRIILEREPQRPSVRLTALVPAERTDLAARRRTEPHKLVSTLRGDLDWVVMKALEKDRRRRYETVNGLTADLRRYQDNDPVGARPPSRLYRLQKLVRRNRVVFFSGGLVFLTLLAGLGTSTWLFLREREARREQIHLRQQAESREKIAQAAVSLSHGDIQGADDLLVGIPLSLIQPSLECANVVRTLGEWHALAGRWDRAAQRYDVLTYVITAVDASDTDNISRSLLPAGAAIAEQGDPVRYDRFRQTAITRFAQTANPIAAEHVLKSSLLRPADSKTLQALAPFAKIVADSLAGTAPSDAKNPYMASWSAFALSLFAYRQGNFAESLEWTRRCLAYPNYNPARQASVRLVVALANEKLNKPEVARQALAEARGLIDAKFSSALEAGNNPRGFWFDWINARLLLREATTATER